jgi:predicted amidohydrolase YtcJ
MHNEIQPSADLIITGAEVWTGEPAQPEAEAVAVLHGRIVAVGTNQKIGLWRGEHTHCIEAGGRLLLPGFNDAHVHFVEGGLQLDNVDLKDATSAGEFTRRIGAYAATMNQREWILGGGWDEQRWDRPALPTKDMIDTVTAGRPVFLHRGDLHMALANSAALQLAGITAQTPNPVGGEIVRDSRGEPTGILKDAAMACVARTIPPLSRERRLHAMRRAMGHAASLGVTSIQHMNPTSADLALYMELAERGELKTRIYAIPLATEWVPHLDLGIRRGFGSPWLRIGALKGFTDGSLGSSTALFFQPYPDQPETSGLLTDEMQPRSAALERLRRADAAGMQLCLHAIGDRAVAIVLDLFEEIVAEHGPGDRRLRLEHAQHVTPADFARFARLGIVASVQPYHAIDDGCWAGQRIGAHRLATSYPNRTFLDHGIPLALGTDWYVAPLNPMLTLYAATTRATLDGKHPGGWIPEQKLTMVEAVRAYTLGSAFAEFQEKEKGTIAPGKLADLVLCRDNIFRIEPAGVKDVMVDLTVVDGEVVYSGL